MTAVTIAPQIFAKLAAPSANITECATCEEMTVNGRPRINHRLTLMLYGTTEERESARQELLNALRESKGLVGPVCEKLQLTRPLYSRLIKRAGLAEMAAQIRVEHGQPGPKSSQIGQEHAPAGTVKRRRRARPSSASA